MLWCGVSTGPINGCKHIERGSKESPASGNWRVGHHSNPRGLTWGPGKERSGIIRVKSVYLKVGKRERKE